MKKFITICMYIHAVLFFLVTGCTKMIDNISNEYPSTSILEIERLIKLKGFDTKNIQEVGDYYIVEKDILFSKQDLQSQIKKSIKPTIIMSSKPVGTISQAHTFNTIDGNLTNITIGLEVRNNRWFYAIREAVDAWNMIPNCRINLIHSYTNSNYPNLDIIIREDQSMPYYGLATWPSQEGKPGKLILVNSRLKNENNTERTKEQDVYMLIHEIGHCLGFRHTDHRNDGTQADGIIGYKLTPGTNEYDNNSVMNSGALGTSNAWEYFSNFSNGDILAAQYLYPPLSNSTFKTVINGDRTKYIRGTIISTSGAGYRGLNYEWRLLGEDGVPIPGTIEGEDAPMIEWTMSKPGTYFIESRVIGLECPGEWAREKVVFY